MKGEYEMEKNDGELTFANGKIHWGTQVIIPNRIKSLTEMVKETEKGF